MAESAHSRPGPGGDRIVTAAQRNRVVDALCEAFAQDKFGTEELERRLDRANRVASKSELEALLADLGPYPREATALTTLGANEQGSGRDPGTSLQSKGSGNAIEFAGSIDPSRVPNRQLSVGFWSGRIRKGSWIPARRITAVALQGGVELDFREAIFGPETVEVSAIAVMGGVEIIVPPNLAVETTGFAVMGGLEDRTDYDPTESPAGPKLRVRGYALMGAVEIDVRLPEETAREAKRRRRKESKETRR